MVKRVTYNNQSDDFSVITRDLKTHTENEQRFSHVVVGTGLFSIPNQPSFPWLDTYKGRLLHVKDLKQVSEFKGQSMLIIGSSFSAEDLALQAYKYGVRRIIITYRTQPLGYKWPEGIEERPMIQRFEDRNAYFMDGTVDEIDVVVLCTGYLIDFPFLPDELRLRTDLNIFPDNLYKGVIWMNGGNNKLMYIGIQYSLYFVNLFEAQAILACNNILGELALPSKEEMVLDINSWTEERNLVDKHNGLQVLKFMGKYFKNIVESVGYRRDVLKTIELMDDMLNDRVENICTFRDKQFRCVYTDELAPSPKTLWLENLDESFDHFLSQY